MSIHPTDPFQALFDTGRPQSAAETALIEKVRQEVAASMLAPRPAPSGLYGLGTTNRDPAELFTKNRINNAFPVALCSWMEDRGLGPVVVRATHRSAAFPWEEVETTFGEAFGLSKRIGSCNVRFEEALASRSGLYIGGQPRFDVILSDDQTERAFENKLIVLPDDKTALKPEHEQRPEAIFRPSTMQNAVVALYEAADPALRKRILAQAKAYGLLQHKDFTQGDTAARHKDDIIRFIDFVVEECHDIQRGLVLMPIWGTCRTQNFFHERAADVFVVTDLAYIDIVRSKAAEGGAEFPRWLRALARAATAMTQLCAAGMYDYRSATSRSDGAQSDKELSLDSRKMLQVLRHPRVVNRLVPADAVREIIGANAPLAPERRFDQVCYIEQIMKETVLATLRLTGTTNNEQD